ncbi:transport protein Avl9-domain-containing protein [Tuber indicum]|nr:transport protein Avl9-domain-containing protein [Tuber indicum]
MDKPQRSPVVTIVGFHHARGPEVETWIGLEKEDDISDWPLLPFLALADGAHASEEDFSYFTLKHTTPAGPTTLFGISCTRQLDASELMDRPADVTRSTSYLLLLPLETTVIGCHHSLVCAEVWARILTDRSRDQFVGLSLREFVYEFKHQTLVLFKCALLQPKMLFFGSSCERLCMTQFSLLSLIPGLLRNLEDCGDPDMNNYESKLKKPTSVKTSDRKSLLTFMGLPLQIFGRGSLFGPYTPLQQLDVLADFGTKSYIVGSTNSLLLQQRDRYSDILINLDDKNINVTSSSLRAALSLSAADRRWIDVLVQSVSESWDESDPTRPKTMGFAGSEDYIRLQFEEYILSMVSSVKYHLFLEKHAGSEQNVFLPDIDGDPANDFQMDWVDAWKKTENFRIFQKFTDSELFDLVPPKHVMAGGLTMEDVQRRILQQMQELRLEEKVQNSKEVLAKTLANGRVNVSTVFNNLSKNVEKFREQRKSQSQDSMQKLSIETGEKPSTDSNPSTTIPSTVVSPVLADASSRAGAYFSSWATWAGEKRKKFAQTPSSPSSEPVQGDGSDRSLPRPLVDPPKNSFEEAIFDSRSRAVYAPSSGRSSPQRASVSGSPAPANVVIKDLDKGRGIGLGIVDAGFQSPPAPPNPSAEEKDELELTSPGPRFRPCGRREEESAPC